MCLSCFSTARYDRAHIQRVSNINACYDAALEREREHHAALLAELARRRALAILVACRTMCLDFASFLDPTPIVRQAALVAQHHARARSRIEQQRLRELQASKQQRDTEIAAHRARVKAAADAFAADNRGQPVAPASASRAGDVLRARVACAIPASELQ